MVVVFNLDLDGQTEKLIVGFEKIKSEKEPFLTLTIQESFDNAAVLTFGNPVVNDDIYEKVKSANNKRTQKVEEDNKLIPNTVDESTNIKTLSTLTATDTTNWDSDFTLKYLEFGDLESHDFTGIKLDLYQSDPVKNKMIELRVNSYKDLIINKLTDDIYLAEVNVDSTSTELGFGSYGSCFGTTPSPSDESVIPSALNDLFSAILSSANIYVPSTIISAICNTASGGVKVDADIRNPKIAVTTAFGSS